MNVATPTRFFIYRIEILKSKFLFVFQNCFSQNMESTMKLTPLINLTNKLSIFFNLN